MKLYTAVLSLLVFSGTAAAQNPDPSKWTCRNLSDSGGYVNPDDFWHPGVPANFTSSRGVGPATGSFEASSAGGSGRTTRGPCGFRFRQPCHSHLLSPETISRLRAPSLCFC